MAKQRTAIRFNTEKSQSWIIGIETLTVGAVVGFICWRSEVHPAVCLGGALATSIVMALLMLYASWFFWLWTLVLSSIASVAAYALVFHTMVEDPIWAAGAGLVAAAVVMSLHVTSRRHAQAEATPNRVTRIT